DGVRTATLGALSIGAVLPDLARVALGKALVVHGRVLVESKRVEVGTNEINGLLRQLAFGVLIDEDLTDLNGLPDEIRRLEVDRSIVENLIHRTALIFGCAANVVSEHLD